MNILMLEPYFTGSHKSFCEEFKSHSSHQVQIISDKGHHWKLRMQTSAIEMANQFNKLTKKPDLIIASDMLNLPLFKSLIKNKSPIAIYFHENQLDYPDHQKRDDHYGMINLSSALCADICFFNSQFHLNSFLSSIEKFSKKLDFKQAINLENLHLKSRVLPLGVNLKQFDKYQVNKIQNRILWNHRWEQDKNPKEFVALMLEIANKNIDFEIALLGTTQEVSQLKNYISISGYLGKEQYIRNVLASSILPVTSHHDFFGVSVVEGIYAGCAPILPRRLAYPEHIPTKFHNEVFYDSPQELKEKLINKLQNPVQNEELKQNVKKYDWSQIIGHYDELLRDFVQSFPLIP